MWRISALLLVLAVFPLQLARSSSAVAKMCSKKCAEAAVLSNVTAVQCKYYCALPRVDQAALCRSTVCLENISCAVACQAYNATAEYSFEKNYFCSRQLITHQRSLIVNFYWLPTAEVHLANIKAAKLIFHKHLNCQYSRTSQSHGCDYLDDVQDLALSLDKTGLLFQTTDYGFGYQVSPTRVDYQLFSSNKSFKMSSATMANGGPIYFLMPECTHPADTREKRCNDAKYSVHEDTEIYPPLVVTIDSLPLVTMTVCSGKNQEFVLSTVLNWSSYMKDGRVRDPDFPLALSCWCWETCDVIHNIHLHYLVNSSLFNLSARVEKNVTTAPINLTLQFYQEQHTNVMSTRWKDVNTAVTGLGIHSNASLDDVSLTVKVHVVVSSYFAVNHYFGSLQAPTVKSWTMDIKLDEEHNCGKSVRNATKATSLPSHPETSPTAVNKKANSNNTTTLILAVNLLVLLAVVVIITVVVCRRKHIFQVWRTEKGLENLKLQRLRLRADSNTSSQHRTNYSYQSALDHWPTFPRSQLKFESRLGHGQFGEVYMAMATGITAGEIQTKVAVKMLQEGKSLKDETDFLEEADHLRKFRHPHVVHLLGVCLEQDPKLIILELMGGGDLLSYLQSHRPEMGRPPWDDAEYVDIALDVASALKYLEKEKFVHRDVAARNCLVSFGTLSRSLPSKPSSSQRIVKLGDFGLGRDIHTHDYYRSMDPKAMLPICWMSPEALKNRVYSAKSDVWSFGILLWEVFTYGDTPYADLAANPIEAYNLITAGVTLTPPQYCPNPMYRLMKQCWAMQPEQRPSFRALHNLLQTFQKSLARRKTLLTTLTSTLQSIASVDDIDEVDTNMCQQPHKQVPTVVLHRAQSGLRSVFIDTVHEQSADELSECQTPGLDDSAFENPSDNSSQSSAVQVYQQSSLKQNYKPGSLLNQSLQISPPLRKKDSKQIVDLSPEDSGLSSYDHTCHIALDAFLLSESSV